jgi:succinate-semialdehyde dehydrogenase/glutarate-semialdehyde dehydrogenase
MESSPIGVIFCVEPWNFPYYQLARVAGPHLMAGNVVLVKHAGIVPQCAIAFEKLWIDAGAPAGLYTNLLISHEQSDRVVDDPRIKGVALTGSVAAGRSIAARAGKNLKPSSMELGGSDAFIVLEDADLEHTIKWAVWGRMYNTGQTCCAAKRFIVVEKLADKFLEKFKAALGGAQARRPDGREDDAGSAVDGIGPGRPPEAGRWRGLPRRQGADGRQAHRSSGLVHAADDPDRHQAGQPGLPRRVLRPVALFFRVKDEDEAIALANDSDFGLGGSVFTKDIARGKRVASRVDTGMMFINNISWSDAELPFGGIKNSGYGRELGDMGIQEFVNKKLVRYVPAEAPV